MILLQNTPDLPHEKVPDMFKAIDMELVITVDESVPGCRIIDDGPMVMPFKIGDTICLSMVELGQVLVFQPLGTADND